MCLILHYEACAVCLILDIANIKASYEEKPEDLFQRLMTSIEDNLLTIVKLLHNDLPQLVKQKYAPELRTKTLASLRPEISMALPSLLDELHSTESIKTLQLQSAKPHAKPHAKTVTNRSSSSFKKQMRMCPLCQQVGRNKTDHFLSSCPFLPEKDKRYVTRTRVVECQDEFSDSEAEDEEDVVVQQVLQPTNTSIVSRVTIRRSPLLNVTYKNKSVDILLDCGAESNIIREDVAKQLGVKIVPNSSQVPSLADGTTALNIVGEVHLSFMRHNLSFHMDALVVDSLSAPILAGMPFLEQNDITIAFRSRSVIFSDGSSYLYSKDQTRIAPNVQRIQTNILRAPNQDITLWPATSMYFQTPNNVSQFEDFILEPRFDTLKENPWQSPIVISQKSGVITVPANQNKPVVIRRSSHLFNIVPLSSSAHGDSSIRSSVTSQQHSPTILHPYSTHVHVDPNNILSPQWKRSFIDLHMKYDDVFDPKYPGYNGAAGPFKAIVNMGPVMPPQRKGRIPMYSRDKLVQLQSKFDELEKHGVVSTPEAAGICVEYLNPSFLVSKPKGDHRLVTAFSEVGQYAKPQPSLMPDVNSTLRYLAQWKFIITTDLTSAFYQIPLDQNSMKFCGTATPFKGIRVYQRSAMGMPGSETALEELLSRVLGDLITNHVVIKMADDLFCGGATLEELFHNWSSVLERLQRCTLRLSPNKTVVCPDTTMILGWVWSQGRLSASKHTISSLSSCTLPKTVKQLRSFIGAVKALSRVLPKCTQFIGPLDTIVAGRESSDLLTWPDEHTLVFKQAQKELSSHKSITMPRPDDELWLATDAASNPPALGATLHIRREGRIHVSGYFSAKVKSHQGRWLPCEIEALAISSAIKHFAPFIIQSTKQCHLLTDSKPCVQAFNKLCRGEFSSSPRLSTFLSTVSQYNVRLLYLCGSANIPSDFASRNAPNCSADECQICKFVSEKATSPVLQSVNNSIIDEPPTIYTTRHAWLLTQQECKDLRRTKAHLTQGTRPSKKLTNIPNVKRYLNKATISNDGLLVVRSEAPFNQTRERIIVPQDVLRGLLTALHLQHNHPTAHQMSTVFNRFFFPLNSSQAIADVTSSCHQCLSLKKLPKQTPIFTTSDPPPALGLRFAADVMIRSRQHILVVRECVSGFISACIVHDEKASTLRDALICLCLPLAPRDGPPAVIRTDPAPGFNALSDDSHLMSLQLQIEIGNRKNPNKNPIAEKAIQELQAELRVMDSSGGPVSAAILCKAVTQLNCRLRHHGLSAREILLKRDQFSNHQIDVDDQPIISDQFTERIRNHEYSTVSKNPKGKISKHQCVEVGDIVYVISDLTKHHPRDRYLVVSVEGDWCNVRKFTGVQFRSHTYRIRQRDCTKVPDMIKQDVLPTDKHELENDADDEHTITRGDPLGSQAPIQLPVNSDALDIPEHLLPTYEHINNTTPPAVCSDRESGTQPKESKLSKSPQSDPVPTQNSETPSVPIPDKPLRYPRRTRRAPKHFQDFVCS